jgi:hypothetical protein
MLIIMRGKRSSTGCSDTFGVLEAVPSMNADFCR